MLLRYIDKLLYHSATRPLKLTHFAFYRLHTTNIFWSHLEDSNSSSNSPLYFTRTRVKWPCVYMKKKIVKFQSVSSCWSKKCWPGSDNGLMQTCSYRRWTGERLTTWLELSNWPGLAANTSSCKPPLSMILSFHPCFLFCFILITPFCFSSTNKLFSELLSMLRPITYFFLIYPYEAF